MEKRWNTNRVKPELLIPAKDLGRMDWVDNRMPSDCLLFVEGQADKHVKNAIKTTASLAEHTDVWCYTGCVYERDLLAPDEILQAIKPKGKTKQYGGSCIIFVDEFKPFFLCKFDTLHHPLFKQTGSSFPDGIPNNTNIADVYGKLKEERHKKIEDIWTDITKRVADLVKPVYQNGYDPIDEISEL